MKGNIELGRHGSFQRCKGANTKPGEPNRKEALGNQFVPFGKPQIPTAALDFGVVVTKAQQAKPEHPGEGADEKRVVPVSPEHHGTEHRPDDQDASHGGRTTLILSRMHARLPDLIQNSSGGA